MTKRQRQDRGAPSLAPRELEVLEQLVGGLAPKAIARELSLSVDTVRWYTKRIYRALDVNNRASAVRVAIETGLVEVGRSSRPVVSEPLRPLVGRERDVRRLTGLIEANRLVTVVGMGGVGKTALAIEVADRYAAGGGAVYEARLQDVVHELALATRIADALGVGLREPGKNPWVALSELAAGFEGLLILDNFEQLLELGAQVESLLAVTPGLTVLVTSRMPLGVSAEVVLPLAGLALPSHGEPPATDWGAIELFIAEVQRRRPGVEASPEVLHIAADVCRLLGGMPLAIVLAASWVDTLTPGEVAASLRSSTDLLTSSGLTPSRHRSVASVIDATVDQLPPRDLRALARLSVFAGGFSAAAAEQVAGITVSTLATLHRASLVQDDVGDRFTVHPLVVQRLAPKLEEAGEGGKARERHRQYFCQLAAGFLESLRGANDALGQPQVIVLMSQEDENLRRAWSEAVASGDLDSLESMAEPVMLWLTQVDDFTGAVYALEEAIAICGDKDVPPTLLALHEWFGWITGTLDAESVRSVAMAEANEPQPDRSALLIVKVVALTLLTNLLGRDAEAEGLASELEGDPDLPPYWDTRRRLSVATLHARRGAHDESIAALDQGLQLALEGGDFFGAHMMLTTVIFIALRAGRTELIEGYERIADDLLAHQFAPGTAQAINCAKGLLELWEGDPSPVPGRLADARDIGGLQVVFFNAFPACLEALRAGLLGDLTVALRARGRIDDARVLPIRPEPVAYAEWGVALAYASLGHFDAARRHANSMRGIETASRGFGEYRMLAHAIEALRLAHDSPAEGRQYLAGDSPPTKATLMYRSWEPLAALQRGDRQ